MIPDPSAISRVECRAASVTDLPELLPVVREFYAHFDFSWDETRKRDLLSQVLADPSLGSLRVVTVDSRIAGYALLPFYFSLEFDGRVALLDELFVTAAARGMGAGGRLLDDCVAALSREGGIRAIRLEVDQRHPEASTLYRRHGFLPDGREAWTRRLTAGSAMAPLSG